MTNQTTYLLAATLAMALATLATRALPFLVFSRRQPPQKLLKTARLVPGAVMTVLVLTGLPLVPGEPALWIPWLSVLVVAALHLTLRHPMISIIGGTGTYMILQHIFGA